MLRAKRTTRNKRALGAVLGSLLGAAAGVAGAKIFDYFSDNGRDQLQSEMIENRISIMEIVKDGVKEIGKHEGIQWATTYTLMELIH